MKYINNTNMLLEGLSQYTGGKAFTLDKNGCSFVSLSEMLFSFILSDEDENFQCELICIAHIAPLPENNDEVSCDLLIQLLKDNHVWSNTAGGIFGFDDKTGFICLSLRLDPLQQTPELFAQKIACLYQVALTYKSRLSVESGTTTTDY